MRKRGDKQRNVGKPPLYGKRMIRKSVCLPAEWVDQLVADFGTFSKGARAVIQKYIKYDRFDSGAE